MGRFLGDLLGTLQPTFKIAKASILAAGLTVNRSVTISNHDITLYDAQETPTAGRIPLRDASNYLRLGRVVSDFVVNRLTSDAGGRILLEVGTSATIAPTNRRVSVDTYLDAFRVYEQGDTSRGLYADLSLCDASAGTRLLTDNLPAYGWGASNTYLTPLLADLNSLDTRSGDYIVISGGGTTGTFPAGVTRGVVLIERMDPTAASTKVVVQTLKAPSSGLSGGHPATWVRTGVTGIGWSAWRQAWDSFNFDPTTKQDALGYTPLNKAGDNLLGVLNGLSTGSISDATGSKARLTALGDGSGSAFIAFHRPGVYAAYLGLGGDNQLRLGGWSMGATSYQIWHEGNLDNTDSAWIALTLTNGWSANATFGTPAYRRIGKLVYLRGVITASSANNNKVAFTLPSGYRPATQSVLGTAGGGFLTTDGLVDVATNGQATVNDIAGGSTCVVSLGGCVLVAA